MNTDPIADMLTRIRNAASARQEVARIPYSKIKENIAEILKKNNFVTDYKINNEGFKTIEVELGSASGNLTNLSRISKPGRRVYTAAHKIPLVLEGRGIVIVSTSSGLMTGKEARKKGLGGELICKVW
ncbi:MAG: 30S ribosomal protein S8 [Candidatus Saccharimonadia bacterium]